MSRFWLKIGWLIHLAHPFHELRTAGMKAASRWRRYQTGRFSRGYFFESKGIVGIGIGSGCHQGVGIGMEWVIIEIICP